MGHGQVLHGWAGRAGLGLPAPGRPRHVAARRTWNVSADSPAVVARRANGEGRRGQLSPLTAPPHSAVLSDRAYPSPLVRYQWAKLP